MQSVEFQTTVKNGIIEIPPEWRGSFKNRVRVTLQVEEESTPTKNLIDQLLARPVRMKTFRRIPKKTYMPDDRTPDCFIDTNIWLYAFVEADDPSKSANVQPLTKS